MAAPAGAPLQLPCNEGAPNRASGFLLGVRATGSTASKVLWQNYRVRVADEGQLCHRGSCLSPPQNHAGPYAPADCNNWKHGGTIGSRVTGVTAAM